MGLIPCERGLQDLIRDLARHYGKRRAFPESTFVDTLVAITYPEIRDFFAMGMLMNVAAAMDLPQICSTDDSWAQELRGVT
mgnify:CR=1 FL=1